MALRPTLSLKEIDSMKVICKNIVCKGRAFEVDQRQARQLDRVICPHCGHQGAMPKGETVTGGEVIEQVARWQKQVLYKKVFKHINKKKLPGSMDKQRQPAQKTKGPPRPPMRAQKKPAQPYKKTGKEKKNIRIKPRRK